MLLFPPSASQHSLAFIDITLDFRLKIILKNIIEQYTLYVENFWYMPSYCQCDYLDLV